MIGYQTRFIKADHSAELVNLYHLARCALSGVEGKNPGSKYDRLIWAADQFHKAHPEVSATGAYKDLDGLLAW